MGTLHPEAGAAFELHGPPQVLAANDGLHPSPVPRISEEIVGLAANPGRAKNPRDDDDIYRDDAKLTQALAKGYPYP